MHSRKQNKGGSRSKRRWQWRGSQMRRCFKHTGVRRGAEVLVRSLRSSRGGCERDAGNTDTKSSQFPAFPVIWVTSYKLGLWLLSCSKGTQAGLLPPSTPSTRFCPQLWGEFCPFPDLVQPQKQGTIMVPLMVSSHPISKLKVFSSCCFLLIVMYVKEICEHSGD